MRYFLDKSDDDILMYKDDRHAKWIIYMGEQTNDDDWGNQPLKVLKDKSHWKEITEDEVFLRLI